MALGWMSHCLLLLGMLMATTPQIDGFFFTRTRKPQNPVSVEYDMAENVTTSILMENDEITNGSVTPMTDIKTQIGSTAVLPCFQPNRGPGAVVWLRNDSTLMSVGHLVFHSDSRIMVEDGRRGDNFDLIIRDLKVTDAGRYSCFLNSRKKTSTKEFFLVVSECNDICPSIYRPVCGSDGKTYPNWCRLRVAQCKSQIGVINVAHEGRCNPSPSIEGPEYIQEGETLTLVCRTSDLEYLNWWKDGRSIRNGTISWDRYGRMSLTMVTTQVSVKDGIQTSFLVITNVAPGYHSGRYNCETNQNISSKVLHVYEHDDYNTPNYVRKNGWDDSTPSYGINYASTRRPNIWDSITTIPRYERRNRWDYSTPSRSYERRNRWDDSTTPRPSYERGNRWDYSTPRRSYERRNRWDDSTLRPSYERRNRWDYSTPRPSYERRNRWDDSTPSSSYERRNRWDDSTPRPSYERRNRWDDSTPRPSYERRNRWDNSTPRPSYERRNRWDDSTPRPSYERRNRWDDSTPNYGRDSYNTGADSLVRHLLKSRVDHPDVYSFPTSGLARKPVNVTLMLSLIDIINIRRKTGEVEMSVWLSLQWTDPLLAWQPELYDNVTSYTLPNKLIWTPDIVPYSLTRPSEPLAPAVALVRHNGGVMSVLAQRMTTMCDVKNVKTGVTCTLKIGSWTQDGNALDMVLPSRQIELDNYFADSSFEIMSTNMTRQVEHYSCCVEPFIHVEASFTFKNK